MSVAEHPDSTEVIQRRHYDRIFSEYEAHYDDAASQAYRIRFFYRPLFSGVQLHGALVLEAMCGSGQATAYLQANGARVAGLDLSTQAIARFRDRWHDCPALCSSIILCALADETFDNVVVIGGLHHLHPHVHEALREVHRVLKPGGLFCFVEPHVGSILDAARRAWYRRDPYFEKNEAALDLEALKAANADRFEVVSEHYGGNIAYFLVLNSLVFRVPLRLKRFYTRPTLWLEAALAPLQSRRWSSFAICQWRRK